jgi:hypothetical protein
MELWGGNWTRFLKKREENCQNFLNSFSIYFYCGCHEELPEVAFYCWESLKNIQPKIKNFRNMKTSKISAFKFFKCESY